MTVPVDIQLLSGIQNVVCCRRRAAAGECEEACGERNSPSVHCPTIHVRLQNMRNADAKYHVPAVIDLTTLLRANRRCRVMTNAVIRSLAPIFGTKTSVAASARSTPRRADAGTRLLRRGHHHGTPGDVPAAFTVPR